MLMVSTCYNSSHDERYQYIFAPQLKSFMFIIFDIFHISGNFELAHTLKRLNIAYGSFTQRETDSDTYPRTGLCPENGYSRHFGDGDAPQFVYNVNISSQYNCSDRLIQREFLRIGTLNQYPSPCMWINHYIIAGSVTEENTFNSFVLCFEIKMASNKIVALWLAYRDLFTSSLKSGATYLLTMVSVL